MTTNNGFSVLAVVEVSSPDGAAVGVAAGAQALQLQPPAIKGSC
jgi:hypothetical protein